MQANPSKGDRSDPINVSQNWEEDTKIRQGWYDESWA